MNSPSVVGCAFMSASLAFHLVRRSSAFGRFRIHAINVFFLVEGTPTCWEDSSTASQQHPAIDRNGDRMSVQFADLRRYCVLSIIRKWAREEMKAWTMLAAAPVVPCRPSSSSFALLAVLPMIASGFRDFIQGTYSGSSKHIRLNCELVALPFRRAHSNALQSWSVMPVKSKMSFSARILLPPPASDDYHFWKCRCGVQGVGTGSLSDRVGVRGRQVGCEGDCGKYGEG